MPEERRVERDGRNKEQGIKIAKPEKRSARESKLTLTRNSTQIAPRPPPLSWARGGWGRVAFDRAIISHGNPCATCDASPCGE